MTALIQQREKSDCGVATVAMLAGVSYEVALQALGKHYQPGVGTRYFDMALNRLGYFSEWRDGVPVGDYMNVHSDILQPWYFKRLAWGHKAMIIVPSLNIEGGHHILYYDGDNVWDPCLLKTYSSFAELQPSDMYIFRRGPSQPVNMELGNDG